MKTTMQSSVAASHAAMPSAEVLDSEAVLSSESSTPISETNDQALLEAGHHIQVWGERIMRNGAGVTLCWIGAMKFTAYEAHAIKPLVANSPFMSWVYQLFSVETFARFLGTGEILIALAIVLRPFQPRISAVGSALAALMFVGTLSFLFTTPGWESSLGGFPALSVVPGQFLIQGSGPPRCRDLGPRGLAASGGKKSPKRSLETNYKRTRPFAPGGNRARPPHPSAGTQRAQEDLLNEPELYDLCVYGQCEGRAREVRIAPESTTGSRTRAISSYLPTERRTSFESETLSTWLQWEATAGRTCSFEAGPRAFFE